MDKIPVNLVDVKEYLRIDGEGEDILLTGLVAAAKEHCENYLNVSLPDIVPNPIRQAILILVAHFYEERAGEGIPQVVYALLAAYRAVKW